MCTEDDRTAQINNLKASDTTAMVSDSYIWGEITAACFFLKKKKEKKKNYFKHDKQALFIPAVMQRGVCIWCFHLAFLAKVVISKII